MRMYTKKIFLLIFIISIFISALQAQIPPAQQKDKDLTFKPKQTPAQKETSVIYPKRHALCIGINKYKSQTVPELQYAENDAKDVAEVLKNLYGFENVTILIGQNATRDNIIRNIGKLQSKKNVGEKDCVIIFFSGHGQTVLSGSRNDGYLITYDAEINFNDIYDPEPYRSTCIRMEDLKTDLESIPAQHILFLADSCYSGYLARKSIDLPADLVGALKYPARQVITAGTQGEKTIESNAWCHGIFTFKLLEILRNEDKPISASKVGVMLKERIPRAIATTYPDQTLTPQAKYLSGEGDFIFIRKDFKAEDFEKILKTAAISPPPAQPVISNLPPPSGFIPASPRDDSAEQSSKLPPVERPKITRLDGPKEPVSLAQAKKGIKISFEGEGPYGVAGYDWSLDGKTIKQTSIGEVIVGSADSGYPDLKPGTYKLSVRSRDFNQPNPNVSEWKTMDINILPNQKPTVKIIYPEENGTVSSNGFILKWRAEDPDGDNIRAVYVAAGHPSLAVKTTGDSYSYKDVPTGSQVVWVQAEDDGEPPQKSDWAQVKFRSIANQPPVCKVVAISPTDSSVGEETTIQLSGTDPEGDSLIYQYKAQDSTLWKDVNGDKIIVKPTSVGEIKFVVSAIDSRANRSQELPINLKVSDKPARGKVEKIDLGQGVILEMVYIRGGSFQMGSPESEKDRGSDEGPVHTVMLSDFWIGKYEITQKQWQAIMGNNPSNWKGEDLPVENVSWNDCQEFCRKLSEKTGKRFTLPTESQWEYSCRAGSQTRFCFGDSDSGLEEYAWYWDNSQTGQTRQTHPVGQKKPNVWGLYDMHGNVWEWCQDWHHDNYNGAPADGSAWELPAGSVRVLRWGSWYNNPRNCRSASRNWGNPNYRYGINGLRVCRGLVRP